MLDRGPINLEEVGRLKKIYACPALHFSKILSLRFGIFLYVFGLVFGISVFHVISISSLYRAIFLVQVYFKNAMACNGYYFLKKIPYILWGDVLVESPIDLCPFDTQGQKKHQRKFFSPCIKR